MIDNQAMNESHFLKLLDKYHKGNPTQEECQFLLRYYNLFESEPGIRELLTEEQRNELKNQIKTAIHTKIGAYEHQKKNKKPKARKRFSVIAASIVSIAVCAAGLVAALYLWQEHNRKILGDISQTFKEHRMISLADGTAVIVSSGSSLKYPSTFKGSSTREVYLEGKAFFDVKHIPGKPFIVHTGPLKTTVMGTEFNIEAWPRDDNISITVAEGKVEISNNDKTFGMLTRDEQLIYNKAKADIVQQSDDPELYVAWKEQDLVLHDVTVAEAANLLEDRFQVKIFCKDELLCSKRFTTTFLKEEGLEKVLNSLCEFNNAKYEYDEKRSVIFLYSK